MSISYLLNYLAAFMLFADPTIRSNTMAAMEYMEHYSCIKFVAYGSSDYDNADLPHKAYLYYVK